MLAQLTVIERGAWSFDDLSGSPSVRFGHTHSWSDIFPYGRSAAHFAHASRHYEVDDQVKCWRTLQTD